MLALPRYQNNTRQRSVPSTIRKVTVMARRHFGWWCGFVGAFTVRMVGGSSPDGACRRDCAFFSDYAQADGMQLLVSRADAAACFGSLFSYPCCSFGHQRNGSATGADHSDVPARASSALQQTLRDGIQDEHGRCHSGGRPPRLLKTTAACHVIQLPARRVKTAATIGSTTASSATTKAATINDSTTETPSASDGGPLPGRVAQRRDEPPPPVGTARWFRWRLLLTSNLPTATASTAPKPTPSVPAPRRLRGRLTCRRTLRRGRSLFGIRLPGPQRERREGTRGIGPSGACSVTLQLDHLSESCLALFKPGPTARTPSTFAARHVHRVGARPQRTD